jgi:Tfp pilus assembly protein PilO
MNMMWKQYKEYIVTGTLTLFSVALVMYGIIPLHKKIQDQMNNSQKILTDREIRDTLVASLPDVRNQKKLVETKEDQLNMIIPKSRIIDLIKNIETLAQETNNTISIDVKDQGITKISGKSIKKDVSDTEKSLIESLPSDKRIVIAITLIGSYPDIVRCVQKIEAMPYETDITAMSLSVQQPGDSIDRPSTNLFSVNNALPANTPSVESIVPSAPNTTLPLQAVFDTVVYISDN